MARMHPFHRTELLVGGEGFDTLQNARVCVIGLGGVGSYAAEALVRSGVGHLTLVDFDKVCLTNVNRQLHATRDTVGKRKAELMGERCNAINPKAEIVALTKFYSAETADEILGDGFDVVLDCIDNMAAKVHLLTRCMTTDQPVICAFGAGGRMDPSRVRVSDISETHTDPFGRIVREQLRLAGLTEGLQCVWTDESPNDLDEAAQAAFRCICHDQDNGMHTCDRRLQVQGTVAWMPAIFGLTMGAAVVHQLLGRELRGADGKPQVRQKPAAGKPSRARKAELLAAAAASEPDAGSANPA